MKIRAVLFDLDGTLADTAPDMGGALNELRSERGLEPFPAGRIRPWVSHGGAALVRLGFPGLAGEEFEALRLRFLALYARRLARETRLFDGGAELIDALDALAVPWGVVTNKPGWLTDPLLEGLGLAARVATVVSGDTLPQKKPHPLPLQHAAAGIGLACAEVAYVGDAERDMLAAQAAGMPGIAARFGYIGPDDVPESWPQVASIDSLAALLPWLQANGLQAGGTRPGAP